MEYTIKEMVSRTGKTEQSLYKLMRKNKEFAAVVAANPPREDGKNRTKYYNQTVLNWLLNYYKKELVENTVAPSKNEAKTADFPQTNAPASKPTNDSLETLQAKIKRQKKKIKSLKADIERLQSDKERLLSLLEKEQEQRQGLLVSLVAEKKEKHILLDEPAKKKKHWWNK